MSQNYPFTLMPLPYPYNALQPYLDQITLHFHHDKHLNTYVENLNKALAPYPQYHSWTLEQILLNLDQFPKEIQTAVRNNAGGVYNHELYFNNMHESERICPAGRLKYDMDATFGSFEKWKELMKQTGLNRFGSGYAWLVYDQKDGLSVLSTANQDTPLTETMTPIITVDVWEHAYYLQYQNRRDSYLDHWFCIINWPFAEQRYEELF